jgi:hypothetical protein
MRLAVRGAALWTEPVVSQSAGTIRMMGIWLTQLPFGYVQVADLSLH